MAEARSAPPPLTPGVGSRRKTFPKLPLSAFSPTTATTAGSGGGGGPAPPSPSTVHPAGVIDAHVGVKDFAQFAAGAKHGGDGDFSTKLNGVVLELTSVDEVEKALAEPPSSSTPIKAIILLLDLASGPPSSTPSFFTSKPSIPIAISTQISKSRTGSSFTAGLTWALSQNVPVIEIDVQANASIDAEGFEWVAEAIGTAQDKVPESTTSVVITNVLPPLSSIDLPIVKLLTHPGYRAYQGHIASLSLVPRTFVKFVPPAWDTAGEGEDGLLSESQVREWKRRVKMYLGPAVEAYGESRIIFGTSAASSGGITRIKAIDWYNLTRESIAEVGVEQEGVDAIFEGNAATAFGLK